METPVNKWKYVLITLITLFVVANSISFFLGVFPGTISSDHIVIIPLYGEITIDQSNSGLINSQKVVADDIISQLREAEQDSSVKAIVLEINSPGGSAVASSEIAETVKSLNKTTYAIIRDVGASGAYWIASATNKIYASPTSITGSIGVISSYLEFSQLFDKYGVTYERLVAGKYKDLGTPFKNLTLDERALLQKKLDRIHQTFINEVVINRNLNQNNINKISTGEFFLGTEALDLGLVDALATKEQAIANIKKELNLTDAQVLEKKKQTSLLELFAKQLPLSFGRGFAQEVLDRNVDTGTIKAQ